ncbi:MAG: class I SAM-dependent methyltransferase [Myxococcales bacterium]|nr:class I SAM-dependent methyltransferase [Myxococcales bacterium]
MSELEKHGRFFDVWSRFYRYAPLGRILRALQRAAIDRARVTRGQRVLDLGCGPADGTALLAQEGAVAFGLDYSEGMLERARREPLVRGLLVRGDAGKLPFRAGSFEKVVCTNSFHHYPDHRAALAEIRRVLKPGGLLVLLDPRRDNPFGLAVDVVERRVFGLVEVHTHSLGDWRRLLAEAGFSSAEVRAGPAWAAWCEVIVEAIA